MGETIDELQIELEAIKNAYDNNNGKQEMERNLDTVLESYPTFKEYKSFLLDILRDSYCMGFLKGYKK